MNVRFLLDENLPPRLKAALWRYDAAVDVLRVGDEGAPVLGTLDPDILPYLEATQRFLVTDNRSSIPSYAADHLAAGATIGGSPGSGRGPAWAGSPNRST